MRYFTDSPYERMMMERRKEQLEEQPPVPPLVYPCHGCDRNKNGCSGLCYRDLIITPKRKETEQCDL